MLIFRLAWRSFLRHRRRSIITVAAVSLSLGMMIFFVGLADDGHARMAELGIRMGSGHVLVQGKGYQDQQTLDYLVTDPGAVADQIRQLPQVKEVAPRVRASGLLAAGGSSTAVIISGVDPAVEPRVSEIPADKRRVDGRYLRVTDKVRFKNQPADIYIGVELAKTLDLAVGDRTVLTLSPRGASRPAAAAFMVRGIFKTGITELDGRYVEIPLQAAQQQLNLDGAVVQLAVHLDALAQTPAVTAALRTKLAGEALEVLSWQEALPELHDAIVLDDAGMYMMMAIIFIIVAIGIFNTVLMSVVERTREFGVMMALGTKPGQLFKVVITEISILALVAAVFGLAVGLGIHSWVASVGIDIGQYAKDYEIGGIVMEGRIYSLLTVPVVLKWTLVVISMTVTSALYPALKAAKMKPLEAIRHV